MQNWAYSSSSSSSSTNFFATQVLNKTSGPLCVTYYTTAVMSMLLWPIVALPYDLRNSSVFSARLNAPSDGRDVIASGSAFQTFVAATGKARSPMVLCNDRGTCSDGDDADRRCLRDSLSATRCSSLPRYVLTPHILAIAPIKFFGVKSVKFGLNFRP